MESLIYLDTHAMVWLYASEVERFPDQSRTAKNRTIRESYPGSLWQ